MKTIALLSGKGGSGKTTLGLTFSSVMSKAGLNVLLVDCDFSTHGATYFFEEQLPVNQDAYCFFDYLAFRHNKNNQFLSNLAENGNGIRFEVNEDGITFEENEDGIKGFIRVMPGFYFVPSVKKVTESIVPFDFLDSNGTERDIRDFIFSLQNHTSLDVIIFDCQAGSSSILPSLLGHMDIVLMVMEPDKVSSSALRSLYTKTRRYLIDKNVFQVFNKVGDEEREFYEKITFGTFFTNVGALLYDWSIRKAFAFSIIPDVENEGIEYGIQICDLCYRIFLDNRIRLHISHYKNQLLLKKKNQEKALLKKDLQNKMLHRQKARFVILGLTILFIAVSIFMGVWGGKTLSYNGVFSLETGLFFGSIGVAGSAGILVAIYYSLFHNDDSVKSEKEMLNSIHQLESDINMIEKNDKVFKNPDE